MLVVATVLVVCSLWVDGGRAQDAAALWRRGGVYDVTSQLHMSEAAAAAAAGRARDVATRRRCSLRVTPRWPAAAGEGALLQFEVLAAWQETRGAGPNSEWARRRGDWASFSGASWAAHWAAGQLLNFYADPAQTTDFLNYQRALTSMFQFQLSDGEYNETDVSGTCNTLYEVVSADIIRKIKRNCRWEERVEEQEPLKCRRVTRVTLDAGELQEVFADEECALDAARARAWTTLRRESAAAPPQHAAAPPQHAAAPPQQAAAALGLHAQPLPLQRDPDPPQEPHMSLADAITQYGDQLRDEDAGEGGTEGAAHAALAVLDAMQRAGAPELRGALHEPGAPPALWRLAGAAGAVAPHAAAAPHLRDATPHPHATHYLQGVALALAPHEDVVRDVLELSERARDEAVRRAATLAAGAAAARGAPALQRDVAAALLRRLARCGDDACRVAAVRALGPLAALAADALLAQAEAGSEAVAAAALRSLEAAPLAAPALRRLGRLALSAGRGLAARGAALLLAAERALRWRPPLLELPARLAAELARRGEEHELRRVLWAALDGSSLPAAQQLIALLPPNIRGWHTLANAGTSSVLERETGWGAEQWNVTLRSVQVAAGGVLRRGGVALRGGGAGGRELLAVTAWTRGLQAWAGGEDAGEDAAAGLALFVGGAALADLTLFSSQSELLALLWAGAGSSDTAVLRAFLPLSAREVAAPLGPAGALLRGGARAGAALALDAAASVSLWGRTAAARLALRGAAARAAWLRAAAGGGAARAGARDAAAGALRIAADLDFYGAAALCVRAELGAQVSGRSVSLAARAGSPPHELRRSAAGSHTAAGRTLALGRDNDFTCRTLGTADL